VYLRRHPTGALYVGITRADLFKNRMRAHERNAARVAMPDAPNELYSWLHEPGEVVDLRLVPDRCAALLLEAEATCSARRVNGSARPPGMRATGAASRGLGSSCSTRSANFFASRGAEDSGASRRAA
jgi:hypothetical protein